jgi:hypothetical protein
MKIVTAHQIEHLGWLGLLDKFSKADLIVLCDSMQFKKNYYENRNKIRTQDDWQWLSVHVETENHKPMKEIKINNEHHWNKKYLKSIIQSYKKSPYFNTYYPKLEEIINKNNIYLIDLNIKLLYQIMDWFGIKKEICFLSKLNINPNFKSTDLLVEIAKKTNADRFLAGPSGKDYIEQYKFEKASIEVKFHEFIHPIYKQQYEPFIPNMSAIDYLFNCGGKID